MARAVSPTEPGHVRLIIVEDDRRYIDDLRELLSAYPLEVEVALDVETARNILEERRMDLALIDVSSPDVDEKQLIEEFKSKFPDMRLMLFNGAKKKSEQRKMRRLGADSYLSKGTDLRTLERAVVRHLGAME